MRQSKHAVSAAALILAIALTGCGGSQGTTASTAGASSIVTLSSSAISGRTLPAQYTCDGKNVSPPLSWGTFPSSIQEIALFAVELPANASSQPKIDWAMAGIKPSVGHIAAGEVPSGAFLVESSNNKSAYSICPPKGRTGKYVFAIFALPPTARTTPEITGPILYQRLNEPTLALRSPVQGRFTVSYKR